MSANPKAKQARFRQDQLVVKSNDLIQKARYSLSLEEQKIICYLLSMVRPGETFLHEMSFSILDYCASAGITFEGGQTYKYIRDSLKSLRDKSFWVVTPSGSERTVSWFWYVEIIENSGTVKVKFDEAMTPYLLFLRGNYTQYQLKNILAMRSKYSVRLYELLKSYINLHSPIQFELDRLKILLNAQTSSYAKYKDFRVRVLEPALREIEDLSDLYVTHETVKKGHAVATIVFRIRAKTTIEGISVWANQDRRFFPDQVSGQISMEDV